MLVACSNDDNMETPLQATISFTTTNYNASFYVAGSTELPTLENFGNDVSFSLVSATNSDAYGINLQTGAIYWGKSLPLGTTEITIMASDNEENEATTSLTILNTNFRGRFLGTINEDQETLQMYFDEDGSVVVLQGFGSNVNGNWTIADNDVTITFSVGDKQFEFIGELFYNELQNPLIVGEYTNDGVEPRFFSMEFEG